jgi:hypothetical protein
MKMKNILSRLALFSLSLAVVSLCFASLSHAVIDLKTAAGIWLFDEGKGDTAKDSSGKGNDGKLVKSPKWVDGKFGKALEFNGTDTCVETGKKLLDNLKEFTIVTWAKPGNIVANRVGLVGQNDAPEFGFIAPTTIQIWTPTGGGLNAPYAHKKDEWHFIAAVCSDKFMKVYIDEQVTEKGGAANHGSSAFNVNIGGCGVYDPTGNWFTGVLDDVGIFHTALSDADMKSIIKEGLGKATGVLAAVDPAGKLATTWGKIKGVR